MASPFALGAPVTDRAGNPEALCRAFRAPFWVCVDGIVVADYGDDEDAAERHTRAHRERIGWTCRGRRLPLAEARAA